MRMVEIVPVPVCTCCGQTHSGYVFKDIATGLYFGKDYSLVQANEISKMYSMLEEENMRKFAPLCRLEVVDLGEEKKH